VTVKSDVETRMMIANIYLEEAKTVLNVPGIMAFIVHNSITKQIINHMKKRGGNTIGTETSDGPLSSKFHQFFHALRDTINQSLQNWNYDYLLILLAVVNFNLHWSNDSNTPKLRNFLEVYLQGLRAYQGTEALLTR
jgi:hypothetical protein